MKRSTLLQHLRRHGCYLKREGSAHSLWTNPSTGFFGYHVNMRLGQRFIARETIIHAAKSYEVIEEYPEDKYFPSYLLLG